MVTEANLESSQAAHPKNEACSVGSALIASLATHFTVLFIFLREDSLTSAESTISLGHFEARNASGLFCDQSELNGLPLLNLVMMSVTNGPPSESKADPSA